MKLVFKKWRPKFIEIEFDGEGCRKLRSRHDAIDYDLQLWLGTHETPLKTPLKPVGTRETSKNQ